MANQISIIGCVHTDITQQLKNTLCDEVANFYLNDNLSIFDRGVISDIIEVNGQKIFLSADLIMRDEINYFVKVQAFQNSKIVLNLILQLSDTGIEAPE